MLREQNLNARMAILKAQTCLIEALQSLNDPEFDKKKTCELLAHAENEISIAMQLIRISGVAALGCFVT